MVQLLHSRKFWMSILDTIISLTLFFVGKYDPVHTEDVKFLIGALQPVFVMVIAGIAIEDAAEKRAGTWLLDNTEEAPVE